ncbi:transporter substrate-binding domain-containing protein [uncultured Brachyspira sp.]|uniref:transporter substrate-binding domain-containing protein n=1 Tax=uncultured Brachyspira sp. TaxID=221953 RepID=UPI0026024627|nr:transporter substrate-binding domain-containing protein [uncultured Brachyspira sp.]
MKLLHLITILIILLFIACKSSYNDDSEKSEEIKYTETNTILTNNQIKVGIYVYDYPFSYLSNNTINGFDYDLISEVARLSDLTIKFMPMQFENLIPLLQENQIDAAIAGMTITEDRKKVIDFSEKYYTSTQAILIKKSSNLKTFNDLKGKTLGVIRGTISDTIISTNKDIIVKRFDNCGSALLSLKVDKLDATMFDKVTCDYYLKYDDNIRLLDGLDYPQEDYGIAVSKGNYALLNTINESLNQIMTNGFYDGLLSKYFDTNLF